MKHCFFLYAPRALSFNYLGINSNYFFTLLTDVCEHIFVTFNTVRMFFLCSLLTWNLIKKVYLINLHNLLIVLAFTEIRKHPIKPPTHLIYNFLLKFRNVGVNDLNIFWQTHLHSLTRNVVPSNFHRNSNSKSVPNANLFAWL